MLWRAAILASYVVLAIVVGVAYGRDGLVVLAYFYFVVGVWFVFLLAWGRIARSAGRWTFDRIDGRTKP